MRLAGRRCWAPGRLDVGIKGDGHHLKPKRCKLYMQCLPHGQVKSTASPRGPRQQQDLATPRAGEFIGAAVEIVQHEVGRRNTLECPAAWCG